MGMPREGRWGAVFATLALSALMAGGASQAAASTIGQVAPPDTCVAGYDDIAGPVTSGNSYVVPENGTITSWTTWAGPTGGEMKMKIFRKFGEPAIYEVVGHEGPRALVGGGIAGNTFPANIPVKRGDVLGFSLPLSDPADGCFFSSPGQYFYRSGDLGDGAADAFTSTDGGRLNIRAEFTPSGQTGPPDGDGGGADFTLGKAKKNKKRGTAKLAVEVPDAGALDLAGESLKPLSKQTSQAGELKLKIKAKGKKKQKLNETGKAKVKPEVTYTPTGGAPSTEGTTVKLVKK